MEPLRYVRQAVAPYVAESGKFAGDPEVLEAINEARRIIYPLGDWKDTIVPLALQVQTGIITLPPWADYIRKSWLGCQHLDIEDNWYQSVEDSTFTRCCGRFMEGGLIDLGERFCTFKDYDGKNFRIKVISLDQRDAGVRLVFHGTSEYGEPVLLTRILDQPNIPVVSDPINDKWVKSITYCEKPLTHDRVYVYIYDPLREVDTLCAIYEATDINPRFRRYRVPRCGAQSQVLSKVKKKWVELANDDELVDIHTDTIIHLLQAITSRMNRDMPGYIAGVKAARQYEDRRLLDATPIRSFSMKMAPIYHETNLGFDL